MPIDLHGLPIAITGASSGIGAATALACARAGMPVALAARRMDRLEDLVRDITALGGRAVAVACDVTNPEDCAALVDRTVAEFGSIYSVFANAGYGIEGRAHEITDKDWRAIFETNFYGTLWTIRPALKHMLASKRGHVLICTSCVAKSGVPYLAAYTATKAAQDHVGRAMRLELEGTGVHVSTVHPIGTVTEFSQVVREKSGNTRFAETPKGLKQTAEHVASTIVRGLARGGPGEIWPSLAARLVFGAGTTFPGLADFILRRHLAKKRG